MQRGGGGSLTLGHAGPDRFAMMALAETISDLVRGTPVTIAHGSAARPLEKVA